MQIGYTVYARQGENGYEDGTVGITLPPTPSLTRTEVNALIDALQIIQGAMRPGSAIPRSDSFNLDDPGQVGGGAP